MGFKNYNKVPSAILEEINEISSDVLKVGFIKQVLKKDIEAGDYKHVGLRMHQDDLEFSDCILPISSQGKYSRYNQFGRTITIKKLPKVEKMFVNDNLYPYGDTSKPPMTVTYTKQVYQKELWLPNFFGINVVIKSEDSESFYILFEVDTYIDKSSPTFNFELLFCINLLQENCGGFNVYCSQNEPKNINNIVQVEWELLPPGTMDITYIQRNFFLQTPERQKEILERRAFIQALEPIKEIRGGNAFNTYFGAMFENDLVVLENTKSGNAIYVFHQDWETLTQYSRTELIKMNTDRITRITHSGKWKKELEAIITSSRVVKS